MPRNARKAGAPRGRGPAIGLCRARLPLGECMSWRVGLILIVGLDRELLCATVAHGRWSVASACSRSAQRALTLVVVGIAACAVVAVCRPLGSRSDALSGGLARLRGRRRRDCRSVGGRASISASFIVVMLAAAFLGPASAALCALARADRRARLRTPLPAAPFNLLGSVGPALVAGNVIRGFHPDRPRRLAFYRRSSPSRQRRSS